MSDLIITGTSESGLLPLALPCGKYDVSRLVEGPKVQAPLQIEQMPMAA